jgi:glutamine amidotransferase
MCRHLAYLGPPVTLASLVLDPDHSIYEQSWAPADMRGGGSVNADGFGLGWYPEGDVTVSGGPVRYRRSVPIWTDENLPGLAGSIRSGAVIAAIRNGTVGCRTAGAVAPFMPGTGCSATTDVIPGWPESTLKLAERLPVADLLRSTHRSTRRCCGR